MADIKGINVAAAVVPYTTDDIYATHFAAYGKGGFRTVTSITQRNSIPLDRLEIGMVVNIPDYPTVGKSIWYTLLSIPVGALADANWKEVVLGGSPVLSPYVLTNVSVTGYISKTAYPTFQAAIDASASGDVIDVYGNTGVSVDGVFNIKPVVSTLADLPPVYVILNGNCNGNIDVKSGNSVLFSGNGTLFGMLAINGGIVVIRKATISKMTGQNTGPGIMFNSGSLAIENAIIKTALNQLSIDTISSVVMRVSLYGILNANPIGANVKVDVIGNNFGTLDNVISITYANALAIHTNKSIEKFNAGVFYRITDRVLQGTGTTGDVVVAAIGDYELSTAGQLYAGIPDYINGVVWQEITNNASLVIYLGKTYTSTSTAGLQDYPNAGTGSWVIQALPNADINGNTIYEWDQIKYSLADDFISLRVDKRGNIVSTTLVIGSTATNTIDQFLWGHDYCQGNNISKSNLNDTFLKAAPQPFIFNNVISYTEFSGLLGTIGIDAPNKILGLTMTGCSMAFSNLSNVTGYIDALTLQKAIVSSSNFNNFSSSVLTDCLIIGLGLPNYSCTFTGNQITKATIVSTTGPTLPTSFSNTIATGTLYMGQNENHINEIIGYNDPKLELPVVVIRPDGTTSYLNYWPNANQAPSGSQIRIRADFGDPGVLYVTPSFCSIYVESNAIFTFERLCSQTFETINPGRMVFSGPGTMRGKIIVYSDNPVKLLIQGLRHEGTFSNDANSIDALNADVKWNNVLCVPPAGYPYLNTRSRNGAYGGAMWFKYQFYQCRFQISGVSDSPSHYVNFAPNTIATAFQLGAFNYSPGPNDAIDKANCLLEATGCSFYGDGVSGNDVLATYGGFATYRFANNTFYGITPALDASDPNFGVFGVLNSPPIVGRLLSGVSTTYATAQLAADAMASAGGGTVVCNVDVLGPLVLSGNVSLLAPGRRIYLDSTAVNTDTLTLNYCIGTIECAEISRDTAGSGYALVINGGNITLKANRVTNTQGYNAIFCNGATLVFRGNADLTYNPTTGTGERIAVLAYNSSNVQMRGNITVYSNDTVGITEGLTCFGLSTLDYEGIITIVNKGRIARNQGGTMTLRGIGRSADKGVYLFNSKTDLFFGIDTRSTVVNVNNSPIVAGINAAGAESYTLLHSGTELLGSIGVASINNANPAAGNYVIQVVNSLIQNNLQGPSITIQYLTPGSGKGTIPWTSTATFAYPDTATYDTPATYSGGNRLFRWNVTTDTTQVVRVAPLSATNTVQAGWVEISPSVTGSSSGATVTLYTGTGFAQDGAMTQAATTNLTGTLVNLTTVDKSSLVNGINENRAFNLSLSSYIGSLNSLQTIAKSDLVTAINEVKNNNTIFGNGTAGSASILRLGWSNTASAYQSAVLGGEGSTASGQYSTVFSGYINQTLGHWASIIGGDHNTIGPANVQAVGAIIGSDHCTINSRYCLISNSTYCTIAQGCDNTTLIGCYNFNVTTGTNQTYINNVLYVPVQLAATTIMLVGAQGNPIATTQVDTLTTASVVIGSDFVWDSSYAIGKTVSMEFCSSATAGKTLAASLYTLAGINVGNSGTSGFTSTPGLARTGTFTLVNGTTYQIRIAVGSGTGYLYSARLIIK